MLWGDLMIMFNQGDTADFWDTQQDWKLISWKLHSSSGVHTIMTSTGLVFHMLWKAKYPAKESTSQMLDLEALETERKLYGFGADSSAKGLTSPEQTATGKGISNPLMAVMVCQKPYGIQLTNVSRVNTPGSDENRLKLYDLMYKIVKVADARVKD
ncbi:hypothetical protein Tco_0599932 [Tanacetum coccineum]